MKIALSILLGSWSEWGACSVTCGSGVQQRVFTCSGCQEAWTRERRECLTPCESHIRTYQGVLQRSKNNIALKSHTIKQILVSSEIQCALYCLRLPECQSINIRTEDIQEHSANPAKPHASLICQLNHATVDSQPEYLVQKSDYRYYGFVLRD